MHPDAMIPFSAKINLPESIGYYYQYNGLELWAEIKELLIDPITKYLKSQGHTIISRTTGFHTFGKSQKPHIHLNFILCYGKNPMPNFSSNYKYFYKSYLLEKYSTIDGAENMQTIDGTELKLTKKNIDEMSKIHFKNYKHFFKQYEDEEIDPTHINTKIIPWLSYPYKEAIDDKNRWKVEPEEYAILAWELTQEKLISYGTARYLASTQKQENKEKQEERRQLKWSQFRDEMDELLETPTKYQMEDLRGVCIIALNKFRESKDRTSVNAVITMAKDYAYLRNIWSNNEILEKYNIG